MIDTRAEAEEWKNTKEYLDRYPTMHEYAEGKRINPKLTDLISRADAIEAVASITMLIHLSNVICDRLMALPSANVEPTVIRSKTLLPTKDFKEWAKRVRETNPNVIVIPCDAEVVSADAVPQLRQTDTLIIADALRYLAKDTERHLVDRTRADALRQQFLKYGASMCKGGDTE